LLPSSPEKAAELDLLLVIFLLGGFSAWAALIPAGAVSGHMATEAFAADPLALATAVMQQACLQAEAPQAAAAAVSKEWMRSRSL
jgi:hypothetical protein